MQNHSQMSNDAAAVTTAAPECRKWHMGIDVGIVNLSFCIIDSVSWKNAQAMQDDKQPLPENPGIIEWRNVSLLPPVPCCNALIKSGPSKGKECGKPASWTAGADVWLCGRHRSKDADSGSDSDGKKSQALCTPVSPSKSKVKSFTAVEIIRMAVKTLDAFADLFKQVETIVIELQPTMNPTMKALSHAILTYFVIRYQADIAEPVLKKVGFSSSKNKLKVPYDGPEIVCNLKGKYAATKNKGKCYTEHLLRNFPGVLERYYFGAGAKKDDLADSFLHCVYSQRLAPRNLKNGEMVAEGSSDQHLGTTKRRKFVVKRVYKKRK